VGMHPQGHRQRPGQRMLRISDRFVMR
jgi:hypothetical protein